MAQPIAPARQLIGGGVMTTAASHDSGERIRPPDDLEHWLTDIRVNLSQDTQAWLETAGDTDHPASEPREGGPGEGEVREDGPGEDEPEEFVGRHRAAD
jgi:hypothetical protein